MERSNVRSKTLISQADKEAQRLNKLINIVAQKKVPKEVKDVAIDIIKNNFGKLLKF